jgi:hypothetical protein
VPIPQICLDAGVQTFDEVIFGTERNDVIVAGEGRHLILGRGGNDTIYGSEEGDCIDGGDGDDVVYGLQGADVIIGGNGEDALFGGPGFDRIVGSEIDGADIDTCDGGADEDIVSCELQAGPQTLAATVVDTSIALVWQAAIYAKSYNVYRAEAADGSYVLLGSSLNAEYVDLLAQPGIAYYYRVTAMFADAFESEVSDIASALVPESTATPLATATPTIEPKVTETPTAMPTATETPTPDPTEESGD